MRAAAAELVAELEAPEVAVPEPLVLVLLAPVADDEPLDAVLAPELLGAPEASPEDGLLEGGSAGEADPPGGGPTDPEYVRELFVRGLAWFGTPVLAPKLLDGAVDA
ncbi:MAG TPA: hypothetical protein VLJ80_06785 [Solirubrobacteraceae bacterium]|nr:hypothetical protein [Solirubrobacteraceae bacterium]